MRAGALLVAAALLCGCAATAPVGGDLHDMKVTDIRGELTWSGTVVVDSIVIVRRGGHLKIEPGTKVLFKRIDWDGDGIGDGEITVEGRLTAVGTRERPLLFASAESEPAPSDWKYLHVNFAEGARVAFARVSHAFSGIQVHYSDAEVTDSEFRHNVDGIRFSTAKLTATRNVSAQNRHGVRYEERGHPAAIEGNRIEGNEVGIFAVTNCFDKSSFTGNDITANRYAVKLGFEQEDDLTFPGNYWGGGDVREAILDKALDPELGAVTVEPVLAALVGVADPFPIPDDADWVRATREDER